MAEQATHRYILFKLLLVVGAVLGVLQLYQTVTSYVFISDRMLEEALYRDSARHLSYILQRGREAEARDAGQWTKLLNEIRTEREPDIAWLKIYNFQGKVLAATDRAPKAVFPKDQIRRVFEPGVRVAVMEATPEGDVFVTLQPFRFRFGRSAMMDTMHSGGPRVIEIALHAESVDPVFGPLRRYMTISMAAAIALLAAMVFLGLRFRNYLHGKQLEQQLELARKVQQDLLPRSPSQGNLDVAAVCDPAWQVGGDFYDVFPAGRDSVSIILGDVSGKGLPAALLMGMLYGAARSAGTLTEVDDLREATRRLNELIHARTSVERFVTMFWCKYDARERLVRYVNAGHLPPIVVHREGNERRLERLEKGGPVLGVIPAAEYEQGEVEFHPGDLLVLYSDGVAEAANDRDEEFGDERLEEILRRTKAETATDIRDEILANVRRFRGGQPLADDLTLMVVRAGARVESKEERFAAQMEVA